MIAACCHEQFSRGRVQTEKEKKDALEKLQSEYFPTLTTNEKANISKYFLTGDTFAETSAASFRTNKKQIDTVRFHQDWWRSSKMATASSVAAVLSLYLSHCFNQGSSVSKPTADGFKQFVGPDIYEKHIFIRDKMELKSFFDAIKSTSTNTPKPNFGPMFFIPSVVYRKKTLTISAVSPERGVVTQERVDSQLFPQQGFDTVGEPQTPSRRKSGTVPQTLSPRTPRSSAYGHERRSSLLSPERTLSGAPLTPRTGTMEKVSSEKIIATKMSDRDIPQAQSDLSEVQKILQLKKFKFLRKEISLLEWVEVNMRLIRYFQLAPSSQSQSDCDPLSPEIIILESDKLKLNDSDKDYFLSLCDSFRAICLEDEKLIYLTDENSIELKSFFREKLEKDELVVYLFFLKNLVRSVQIYLWYLNQQDFEDKKELMEDYAQVTLNLIIGIRNLAERLRLDPVENNAIITAIQDAKKRQEIIDAEGRFLQCVDNMVRLVLELLADESPFQEYKTTLESPSGKSDTSSADEGHSSGEFIFSPKKSPEDDDDSWLRRNVTTTQ